MTTTPARTPLNARTNGGQVRVVPGALDPNASSLGGAGVQMGRAGAVTSLYMLLRDSFGNKLQSLPEGMRLSINLTSSASRGPDGRYAYNASGRTPIAVVGVVDLGSLSNGRVAATYNAPMPGVYLLRASVGGVPLAPPNCSTRAGLSRCTEYASSTLVSPGLPPVAVSARLSDSGGRIVVDFAADTDRAGLEGAFACGLLFDAPTVARLGSARGASCRSVSDAWSCQWSY